LHGLDEIRRVVLSAPGDAAVEERLKSNFSAEVNQMLRGVFIGLKIKPNLKPMYFTAGHLSNLDVILEVLTSRHGICWTAAPAGVRWLRESQPGCVLQLCGAEPVDRKQNAYTMTEATTLPQHHLKGVADLIGSLVVTDKCARPACT